MIYNPENLTKVIDRLRDELGHMPRFPDTDARLLSYTKAFMRILRDLPFKCFATIDDMIAERDGRVVDAKVYLPWVEEEMGKLPPGIVNDLDWIIQTISTNCEVFPQPIEVFRMYDYRWGAANRRQVEPSQIALAGE
jgi:hypothetical protein